MRSTSSARKMKKKVGSIPMDQGQEPAARKLLQQGMLVGSWVLLQNCHLGLKMMRELETTIIQKRATEPEEVHDEFRCWISAEPHPLFPIGLLHMSIKVGPTRRRRASAPASTARTRGSPRTTWTRPRTPPGALLEPRTPAPRTPPRACKCSPRITSLPLKLGKITHCTTRRRREGQPRRRE